MGRVLKPNGQAYEISVVGADITNLPQLSLEWGLPDFQHYSMPVSNKESLIYQHRYPVLLFLLWLDVWRTKACTFSAGPLSEALSLARFPSRPSWTNSSKRFTISSSTSCSPCRLAAMLARAFITAREQCLKRKMTQTRREYLYSKVYMNKTPTRYLFCLQIFIF